MSEVRTAKGKLVGVVDERTGTLHIRDGKKTTVIEIPATGLNLMFSTSNGKYEQVYILPPGNAQIHV
jgi:hypothetical protein